VPAGTAIGSRFGQAIPPFIGLSLHFLASHATIITNTVLRPSPGTYTLFRGGAQFPTGGDGFDPCGSAAEVRDPDRFFIEAFRLTRCNSGTDSYSLDGRKRKGTVVFAVLAADRPCCRIVL